MNWRLWQRPEKRQANYTDTLVNVLLSAATGRDTNITKTAALECASGALGRALSHATVQAHNSMASSGVTGAVLAQIGRDLILRGQSLHLIDVSVTGAVRLHPVAIWDVDGGLDPETWIFRATLYGASGHTITRYLPYSAFVFLTWSTAPNAPYRGLGPLDTATLTARLNAESTRSLADEASGPITNIVPIPQDGGGGGDDDPLASLKSDIAKARGKASLVETTAGGWGEGMPSAPRADWKPQRLGPNPPSSLDSISERSFGEMLAACGVPPGLYMAGADGTAQRESLRRFHLQTVLPLAKMVETELSAKLMTPISLSFDNYPLDLQGRASAFQKMVQGGMDTNKALAVTGLLMADDG